MEFKAIVTEHKFIGDREVEGIASVTGILDLGNDRMASRAFKKTLKERKDKVRHLWQHDFTQPPTAVITEIEEVDRTQLPGKILRKFPEAEGGLRVVRSYLDTERGNEVLAGVKSGAITEMSIGYDPIKVEFKDEEQTENGVIVSTRILKEVALYDTSDVNWGMNQATVALKTAVPFIPTGTIRGQAWVVPSLSDFTDQAWEDLPEPELKRIAQHFTCAQWMRDDFGSFQLPHHLPSKGKVGPAVWSGVIYAMSQLMNPNLPLNFASRSGAYAHLAKHYQEFHEEPPDFSVIEFVRKAAQVIDTEKLFEMIAPVWGTPKAEKAISDIRNVVVLLQAADPHSLKPPSGAVTEAILLRLKFAERELL